MTEVDEKLRFIADQIIGMGLAVPAVFFLEMNKPLRGIVQTGADAFKQVLAMALGQSNMDTLVELLKSEDAIERLIRLIESNGCASESSEPKDGL